MKINKNNKKNNHVYKLLKAFLFLVIIYAIVLSIYIYANVNKQNNSLVNLSIDSEYKQLLEYCYTNNTCEYTDIKQTYDEYISYENNLSHKENTLDKIVYISNMIPQLYKPFLSVDNKDYYQSLSYDQNIVLINFYINHLYINYINYTNENKDNTKKMVELIGKDNLEVYIKTYVKLINKLEIDKGMKDTTKIVNYINLKSKLQTIFE